MNVPFFKKNERAMLDLFIPIAMINICKCVPENAVPSLGFFPGLGTFSELDLYNGIGFLPSVKKIGLYRS